MTDEHEENRFEGPWWRYPPLRNALLAGLIAGAEFGLANLGFIRNASRMFSTGLRSRSAVGTGRAMTSRSCSKTKRSVLQSDDCRDRRQRPLGLWDEAAVLVFLYGTAESTEECTYASTRASIRALRMRLPTSSALTTCAPT